MHITRIVTCYRQWELLARWLDTPTLHELRIRWIVVNDDPTDTPPPALVSIMAKRNITVITPLFNLGRSRARNLGAQRAETAYIEHVDGDDIPLPVPSDFVPVLDDRSLHVFPVPEFTTDEELKRIQMGVSALPIRAAWSELLPRLHPIDVRPAALIWPRKIFLELGGYDARYEGAEDFDLALRFQETKFDLIRHPCPKQAYRITKQNSNRDALHIEGHLRIWERLIRGRDSSPNIKHWEAKETAYAWLIISRKLLQRFPALASFFRKRLG